MSSNSPIARHVFHPQTSGTDRVLAWREATNEPVFSWGSRTGDVNGYCFHSLKRSFRKWLEATDEADLTVYHDGMGADALGPMDACGRKVLFLHNWFPRWEKNFEWMIRCTGRVMISEFAHLQVLEKRFAWVPGKYQQVVSGMRIADTLVSTHNESAQKKRAGVWLHGRQWKAFGNRLRSVIDGWSPDAGEIEIVAEGKAAPKWARGAHVKWSMNLPLEFALLRMYTWDSTLLLSDYSLDSPWLIRALELGCFPLVPDGQSVAHSGLWEDVSAPQPYEWGSVASILDLLASWRACGKEQRLAFSEWVERVVGGEQEGHSFQVQWQRAKDVIVSQRSPDLRLRKSVSSLFPVSLYEYTQRLRAGY